MNGVLAKFKNFGMLELLVILSALYIIFMLGWTATSRSGSEEKAQIVRENHKKIVELINLEINECDRGDENSNTVWGDPCKSEWIANNIIKYVAESLNLTNPYSKDSPPKPFVPVTIFLSITKPPPQPEPKITPKTIL